MKPHAPTRAGITIFAGVCRGIRFNNSPIQRIQEEEMSTGGLGPHVYTRQRQSCVNWADKRYQMSRLDLQRFGACSTAVLASLGCLAVQISSSTGEVGSSQVCNSCKTVTNAEVCCLMTSYQQRCVSGVTAQDYFHATLHLDC